MADTAPAGIGEARVSGRITKTMAEIQPVPQLDADDDGRPPAMIGKSPRLPVVTSVTESASSTPFIRIVASGIGAVMSIVLVTTAAADKL